MKKLQNSLFLLYSLMRKELSVHCTSWRPLCRWDSFDNSEKTEVTFFIMSNCCSGIFLNHLHWKWNSWKNVLKTTAEMLKDSETIFTGLENVLGIFWKILWLWFFRPWRKVFGHCRKTFHPQPKLSWIQNLY